MKLFKCLGIFLNKNFQEGPLPKIPNVVTLWERTTSCRWVTG